MRKTAVVCLSIAAMCASIFVSQASASAGAPREGRKLAGGKTAIDGAARGKSASPIRVSGVLAYPPSDPSEPVVVYLHGIHGLAENGCPWMRGGDGWLVCPEAKVKDGAGWSWTGVARDDAQVVRDAVAATSSDAPVVAVGFSQGAYVALDLVRTKSVRFRALVLLGADVTPDAKLLSSAGITRVVLGGSEHEPWHGAVARHSARLAREGIAARFVSLGRVGHTYVAEDPSVVREAIAWASAS